MFVKHKNSRFEKVMWGDHRLLGAASNFCLCSCCAKSDITEGVICPIHEEFMQLTQRLQIAAPIFACPDFLELKEVFNFLDQYYDEPNRAFLEKVSKDPELPTNAAKRTRRIKEQWVAQLKKWEKEKV